MIFMHVLNVRPGVKEKWRGREYDRKGYLDPVMSKC